jgi:hypothetical protein
LSEAIAAAGNEPANQQCPQNLGSKRSSDRQRHWWQARTLPPHQYRYRRPCLPGWRCNCPAAR